MIYTILAVIGFLMCLNEGQAFPYLNLVGLVIFVASMKKINTGMSKRKINYFKKLKFL